MRIKPSWWLAAFVAGVIAWILLGVQTCHVIGGRG